MENKGFLAQLISLGFLAVASLSLTWSLTSFAQDVKTLKTLQHQLKSSYRRGPIDSYCKSDSTPKRPISNPTPSSIPAFIGTDHPKRLPIQETFIKMIAQESTHYSILAPEAEAEWLWTATVGDGHVRLGKEERMFAVAMFHQLHCVRSFRGIIERGGWETLSVARQHHILHCFNYLRQWTLCSADVTLEKGDFMKRNFTTQRTGATHTCIDWLPAYEMMKDRWKEWDAYRVAHGIPWHDDVT